MPTDKLTRALLCSLLAAAAAAAQEPDAGPEAAAPGTPQPTGQNPYKLEPFFADFPVELEYPPHAALRFEGTRRQILQRLAANLQGNVGRETWKVATEFFWRAPEDAVEPLIEAMDRAMVSPALGDVVRNCVEAMGKMANTEFDGALRRALQHKKDVVRQGAYAALARSGTLDTLRELRQAYYQMNGRARTAWLRAVRERLPLEDATRILAELTQERLPPSARDEILSETRQLPPAAAAEVLRSRWDESLDELRAVIAGVLHAAGDATGTVYLREALQSEDLQQLQWALKHCAFGPDPSAALGELREYVLRATTHQDLGVRKAAVVRLLRVEGDDVVDALEVCTDPAEKWEIRGLALRELTRRGRNHIVSAMVDELPTATGTHFVGLVNQLSVSGDERAVPIIVERFHKAGDGQGRPLLQALAQNASRAATVALCELFVGPEVVVAEASSRTLTTRSYLPTLLLNARGNEDVVVDAFLALAKDQTELRARLLSTLTGIAADRRGQPDVQRRCIDAVRGVLFDRADAPQLRVLALNLLTRNWLTIDDVLRLRASMPDEQPGMRHLLNDFLVAYF